MLLSAEKNKNISRKARKDRKGNSNYYIYPKCNTWRERKIYETDNSIDNIRYSAGQPGLWKLVLIVVYERLDEDYCSGNIRFPVGIRDDYLVFLQSRGQSNRYARTGGA